MSRSLPLLVLLIALSPFVVAQSTPSVTNDRISELRRAAEQGNARAQFNLALMYYNGEGVPKNAAEAVKWYRRAAEQGLAEAQINLGVMYGQGEGVPKSSIDAYFWFNLAAAQGIEEAQINRDIAEKKMTREQIVVAKRRSAAWTPKPE